MTIDKVAEECAEEMVSEDSSLITIYYGADVSRKRRRRHSAISSLEKYIRLRCGRAERRSAAVLLPDRG